MFSPLRRPLSLRVLLFGVLLCLVTLISAAVPTNRLPASRNNSVVSLLNRGTLCAVLIGTAPEEGHNPDPVYSWDLSKPDGSENFKLKLVDAKNGYWVLKSMGRSQVLEIDGGSSTPGAVVQGWTPSTTDTKFNMFWEIFVTYQGWDRVLLSFRNVKGGLWLRMDDPVRLGKIYGSKWEDSATLQWQPIVL